jgi:hypothetical protein
MVITGGDQHKAERIARDIVRDLTVSDIEWTITEGLGREGEQRLCAAVDDDFVKNEDRLYALSHRISDALGKNDDLSKLFIEYEDLAISTSGARQKASFLLGYQAALRLCDPAPGKRLQIDRKTHSAKSKTIRKKGRENAQAAGNGQR